MVSNAEVHKGKQGGKKRSYTLTQKQKTYILIKRVLDIMITVPLLLLMAIPILFLVFVHKVVNPHEPVFFRQERVGKDEELFTLIKFSSMKRNAPRYAATNAFADEEEYVTKFGYFLRSTSLDEVPQLVQVLTGKMSLIGPRPLIPQEESMHSLRRKAGVYQLRPGITGWAQVNGRDMLTDEKKAAYDQEYLEKISFSMDWKIFWMTIKKVIFCEDVRI